MARRGVAGAERVTADERARPHADELSALHQRPGGVSVVTRGGELGRVHDARVGQEAQAQHSFMDWSVAALRPGR